MEKSLCIYGRIIVLKVSAIWGWPGLLSVLRVAQIGVGIVWSSWYRNKMSYICFYQLHSFLWFVFCLWLVHYKYIIAIQLALECFWDSAVQTWENRARAHSFRTYLFSLCHVKPKMNDARSQTVYNKPLSWHRELAVSRQWRCLRHLRTTVLSYGRFHVHIANLIHELNEKSCLKEFEKTLITTKK